MSQRWTLGLVGTLAAAAASCGGSVNLNGPEGTAGSAPSGVSGEGSGGASSAGSATAQGGRGAEGGSDDSSTLGGAAEPGSAGAASEPALGYALEILQAPAPLPPEVPVFIRAISRNGQLLLGEADKRPMFWTPMGGSQWVAVPSLPASAIFISHCVAEDGSRAIFSIYSHYPEPNEPMRFFSFAPGSEPELIWSSAEGSDAYFKGCAADASRALFSVRDETYYYWDVDQGTTEPLADPPPPGTKEGSVLLSQDAAVGVRCFASAAPPFAANCYRWSPSGLMQELEPGCWPTHINGDASVIVGSCEDPMNPLELLSFRWTEGGTEMLSPVAQIYALSRNGATMVSSCDFQNHEERCAGIWRGEQPMQALELGYPLGLADDGDSGFFNDPERGGLRWSVEGGIEPLLAPNGSKAELNAATRGDTTEHWAALGNTTPRYYDSLVWDRVGVRDVLLELRKVGLDQEVQFINPESGQGEGWMPIWVDEAIYVHGGCLDDIGPIRSCIARLPLR